MTRLIGLAGERGDELQTWINPDHVVQLTPHVNADGQSLHLTVEVKLIGLPLLRSNLGHFIDAEAVDVAWQSFLTRIGASQDSSL